MFNWDPQTRTAAANGDGGTSKLLVATSRAASGNGLDRGISGQWEGEGVCDGGSPHRGASRGHRNEPFFIGVAGGTASGECRRRVLASIWATPLRACYLLLRPLSNSFCLSLQARRQSATRSSSGCTVRCLAAPAGRLPLSAAACLRPPPLRCPTLAAAPAPMQTSAWSCSVKIRSTGTSQRRSSRM